MTDGVSGSSLAGQPIGETAEVASGVYQLKLPVPLPLRYISVYLIEGREGWTVVDAGYDYPETYTVWKAAIDTLGLDLRRDIARIIVTHFHPDHLGAARWLQEQSGSSVYMLEEEIEFSRRLWGGVEGPEPFVEHLSLHGMPRETAVSASGEMRSGLTLPEVMEPLEAGEKIPIGSGSAQVLRAPGHADNQLILYDEGRKTLFAADHVMLKITPNIGLWPETAPHPLARYLESLDEMRHLDADLILPGHGPVFHDLAGRVSELTRHHEERLDLMHAVLDGGPESAYAVSLEVFRDTLTIYEQCFALAETLAHLDHLELRGRANRVEREGLVLYETT